MLPDTVFHELLQLRSFGYDLKEVLAADWIEVKSAANTAEVQRLLYNLDAGEAEAIVLAKELQADLLLMDEMKGRAFAEREGIAIIGLAGVLAEAKAEGHIPFVRPLLDQLIRDANFRIGQKLYDLILAKTGELP